MLDIVPVVLVAVAVILATRFFDLRRIDDPFVTAFLFMSVFWIAGAGMGYRFPTAAQVTFPTFVLLTSSYFALLVGGIVGRSLARLREDRLRYEQLHPALGSSAIDTRSQTVAIAIGIFLVVAFIAVVGGIPVLSESGEQARVDSRAGLGPLVIGAIWLISLPAVALIGHLTATGRQRTAVLAIGVLSAGALAVFGNREQVLVLVLASAWVVLTAGGRLPRWRHVVALGAISLIALAIAAMLRSGAIPSVELLLGRLQWQFYVGGSNLQRLVDLIPSELPYLLGRGYLIDLAVLLPGPQPNFGLWLKEMMGLDFQGAGITIGLTGEFYANFGAAVAVAGSFAVGAGLAMIRPLIQLKKPLDAAFAVLLALSAGGFVQSGLISVMLYSVLPLGFVYLGLRAAAPTLFLLTRRSSVGLHKQARS
jgi:hypothetical protein